jgi:hypothetical protein
MIEKGKMIASGIGLGAVEAVSIVPIESVETIGKLLIQLAIGIITLWKVLKKDKPKN